MLSLIFWGLSVPPDHRGLQVPVPQMGTPWIGLQQMGNRGRTHPWNCYGPDSAGPRQPWSCCIKRTGGKLRLYEDRFPQLGYQQRRRGLLRLRHPLCACSWEGAGFSSPHVPRAGDAGLPPPTRMGTTHRLANVRVRGVGKARRPNLTFAFQTLISAKQITVIIPFAYFVQ